MLQDLSVKITGKTLTAGGTLYAMPRLLSTEFKFNDDPGQRTKYLSENRIFLCGAGGGEAATRTTKKYSIFG
jgi:hypothetical protein